jgi:hypothetical protein
MLATTYIRAEPKMRRMSKRKTDPRGLRAKREKRV